MSSLKRESVSVLEECIELQLRKSRDYQNEKSNVQQADHYRRGVSTIHDMISQKLLRAQSLLEAYENGESRSPNFESLEDTYKDLINYASFAVSYLRGKMEGQDPSRDMLNRPIVPSFGPWSETEISQEDTSGGSSSGLATEMFQESISREPIETVEQDGFITVVPKLLTRTLGEADQRISLNELELKQSPTDVQIKGRYFREVLPKGRVRVPDGEVNCTDSVQHAYVNKMRRKKPKDIGDRMDGDFDELAKKKSER